MSEPPITLRATYSSFTAGDNAHPTRVVIHSTCPTIGYPAASAAGTALSTARYFAGGHAGGSAHYVVDISDEQHCVPDDTIAFHAPPNQGSIGIEICSEGGDYPQNYTREQWLSPQVWPAVQRAAVRTAELCARFGIPAVRIGTPELLASAHGICGHVDVSQAWHQSTHSDPNNSTFPWPEFMAAVGSPNPQTSGDPVLIERVIPSGPYAVRIICPVGKASAYLKTGWVSAVVNGPAAGTAHVWFQNDTGGISDLAWTIPFADGHSGRIPTPLPDGTTQVVVQCNFPQGGLVTVEAG